MNRKDRDRGAEMKLTERTRTPSGVSDVLSFVTE